MNVDKKLIEQVAEVARLKLSEKEKERFVKDFKEILDSFSTIDKCDTKGYEAVAQPVEIKNVLREDSVEDSFSQEQALANAKHKKNGYFKGPKAV